jgi:hypothetical protein
VGRVNCKKGRGVFVGCRFALYFVAVASKQAISLLMQKDCGKATGD